MKNEWHESVIRAVLTRGLDDWLYFAEFDGIVHELTSEESKEKRLDLELDIIKEMLTNRWIELGTIDSADGFVPWNLPLNDVISRVKDSAIALQRDYWPGDICWLSNTATGDIVARAS